MIPGGKPIHVCTDGFDSPSELVADDARIAGKWIRAVQDVEIRAADASSFRAQQNFTRSGMLGRRNLAGLEVVG
jgi:hypothetical protein